MTRVGGVGKPEIDAADDVELAGLFERLICASRVALTIHGLLEWVVAHVHQPRLDMCTYAGECPLVY